MLLLSQLYKWIVRKVEKLCSLIKVTQPVSEQNLHWSLEDTRGRILNHVTDFINCSTNGSQWLPVHNSWDPHTWLKSIMIQFNPIASCSEYEIALGSIPEQACDL
jgi:hypothetical protein